MTEAIWITGGNGMVGRSITAAIRHQSPDTVVLTPSSQQLDLTDHRAVESFVIAVQPSLVIHAAGRVGGIAANIANPVEFLDENMRMGLNVIRACRDHAVPNLINIGSSCMYPKDHQGLLTEDMVLAGSIEPTNEGYALAKIAADRMCEFVAKQDGFAYRTVIPSNLYGPGDHFDEQRGHLLANVIRKMHAAVVNCDSQVIVWGDGTARREFTFVEDVAEFIAGLALQRSLQGLPYRLNIGSGTDHSVTEFYEAVANVVGFSGRFVFDTSKPTGMARKLMDSSRAVVYGWKAETSLPSGLARTYDHYTEKVASIHVE